MPKKTTRKEKQQEIKSNNIISIPKFDGNTSPHIPQNGGKFIDHGNILKVLELGIKENMPILLIGESGTGKTSAIRYLAAETNNGLRRINLNGGTTADELIGRIMIKDTGTYWVDGVLVEAMRNGEWIVLDEINAALPEVLFILQSILDDDGYIVLNEKDDKEIVRKHPNFRFFATCNPPDYAGTKEMNQALLSRFPICINANFPPEHIEKKIVEHHLGGAIAESELTEKLIAIAKDSRIAKETGKKDYVMNTRDILNTLKLAQNLTPIDAFCMAFANKLEKTETSAIKAIAVIQLPRLKKETGAKTKINNPEEITIGNQYEVDTDIEDAYYALTETKAAQEEMIKKSLKEIIIENPKKHQACQGDKFEIIGTFYIKGQGIDLQERTDLNEKVASIVEFTEGIHKNKRAIIVLNTAKAKQPSIQLLENIYEIN